MANWLVLSIVIIMVIIFMVFVLPQFAGTPSTEKKLSLQQFCGQFKLQSRQHIFQGIRQCYQTTTTGAAVTEVACDVDETSGIFSFKGDCPLVPAPPPVKLPNGQVK